MARTFTHVLWMVLVVLATARCSIFGRDGSNSTDTTGETVDVIAPSIDADGFGGGDDLYLAALNAIALAASYDPDNVTEITSDMDCPSSLGRSCQKVKALLVTSLLETARANLSQSIDLLRQVAQGSKLSWVESVTVDGEARSCRAPIQSGPGTIECMEAKLDELWKTPEQGEDELRSLIYHELAHLMGISDEAMADAMGALIALEVGKQQLSAVRQKIYRKFYEPLMDHLYSTSATDANQFGYILEQVAFETLSAKGIGTVPLYQCLSGSIRYLEVSSCAPGNLDRDLGHISASEQPGMLALHRYYHPTLKVYFATLYPERESLSGWSYDRILGYAYETKEQ